jgi:hypothetical protein
LREYTEVMESNPGILDLYFRADGLEDDWLNDVSVVVRRDEEAEVMVEEIEGGY